MCVKHVKLTKKKKKKSFVCFQFPAFITSTFSVSKLKISKPFGLRGKYQGCKPFEREVHPLDSYSCSNKKYRD